MSEKTKTTLILSCLLLIAAAVFGIGISWGLPSRAIDPILFGDRTPWTGKEVFDLAGGWKDDAKRGADVDADPLDRSKSVVLNGTDAERAAIVLKYRLYSYQPDEMITFRALARMKPGKGEFDPGLYQYGGLWVYPVGAMLKAASFRDVFLHVTSDIPFYLEHPEAFGRFYIVARLYSVMWGLVGVAAVFCLARRTTGGDLLAAAAAMLFIALPVVVNMAHEAKPHLGGAVLGLLAVVAACRYVDRGTMRAALLAGAVCGASLGMVLSMLPVFVILPLMTRLRRDAWSHRVKTALAAISVGVAVFAISNPYLVLHAVRGDDVLKSNLGNSAAMYHTKAIVPGIISVGGALVNGMGGAMAVTTMVVIGSATIAILFVAGALMIWKLRDRDRVLFSWQRLAPNWSLDDRREAMGRAAPVWLLGAASLLVILQAIPVAAGKPGEFGRFFIVPDVFAVLLLVYVFGLMPARRLMFGAAILICAITGVTTASYMWGFIRDASDRPSRTIVGERLKDLADQQAHVLNVVTEPAPYAVPPMDLWRWTIVLPPRGADFDANGDVHLRTVDYTDKVLLINEQGFHAKLWIRPKLGETPISWAAKPMKIVYRDGLVVRE